MKKQLLLLATVLLISSIVFSACGKAENEMYIAEVETSHGDIVIALLDETPLHRDNFIENVEEGFYDDMKFHRVIKGFVIQAGDPKTKEKDYPKSEYGEGGNDKLVKVEIYRNAVHTMGAVGMARMGDDVNPERNSSGSHFYIVPGKNGVTKERMETTAEKNGYEYSEKEMAEYLKNGGTPNLDGAYVVFGYVVEGIETVATIENAEKDARDVPNDDFVIEEIKIKKMSKKEIEKKYNYYAR